MFKQLWFVYGHQRKGSRKIFFSLLHHHRRHPLKYHLSSDWDICLAPLKKIMEKRPEQHRQQQQQNRIKYA